MKSMLFAIVAVFAYATSFADDLNIARQALRDGIWDVARNYALKTHGDEGRLIVLESYARESHWQSILTMLKGWGDPEGEGFLCYRAMALAKTGDSKAARKLLDGAEFKDADLAKIAVRITAALCLDDGEPADALKALSAGESDDVDFRMLKAEALAAKGDRKEADEIWRTVVATTNAPESAVASAASRLDDAEVLRNAYEKVQSASLRRSVGVRLGMALLRDRNTFDEGSRIIRSIVRDAPDSDGARDGYLALADALLDRKSWASAAEVYDEMLEIWPDVAKDASFQEGRGWVLIETGKPEEALAAFDSAVELAEDDSTKAMSLVKAADVLSMLNRGDEAMARYRRVREEFPKTMAAERIAGLVRLHELEEKGRTQYGEYRFAEAQETFEKVAEENPSRRNKMEFYVVMCLYGQGRDDEAVDKANTLAEDESVDSSLRAEATLWLAKYAYNKARWKEAAERFLAYADLSGSPSMVAAAIVWASRAYFADNDFQHAVSTVGRMSETDADPSTLAAGRLLQGEALMELARFDEAVIALERAALAAGMSTEERFRAQILKADALFAMGSDNPVRYHSALDAYRTLQLGADITPSQKISIAFKIGKTLERMKKTEESIDQYYTQVVLAYRNGRENGVIYSDEAHADFSRAAFRLADEYESRGQDHQAVSILSLIVASEIPAADEASRRIERIRKKGRYL